MSVEWTDIVGLSPWAVLMSLSFPLQCRLALVYLFGQFEYI